MKSRSTNTNCLIHIKDIDSGEEFHFKLVTAENSCNQGEEISINSPLGAVLVGRKVGEIIHWRAPARQRTFLIKTVL